MRTIAIIGQKNVGKSSLFNLLTRSNLSTSINYSGYTRDCLSSIIKIDSFIYKIYDTPGLGYEKDDLDFLTLKFAWNIIKKVDLIIFLTDNSCSDILDKNFFNILEKFNNKKIYVINKCDIIKDISFFYKSYSLKDFIYISVKNQYGIDILLKKISNYFVLDDSIDYKNEGSLKVSIIGKQNVGKSSFFNCLINKNVSLVYDNFGTTKDFIFDFFRNGNNNYTVIDTPGYKKLGINNIDIYFFKKILNLLKESDVIFFISDSKLNISKYDMSVIKIILNLKKVFFFIFNKSDLLNKNFLNKFYFSNLYNFLLLNMIPYRFVSSKYSFGIKNIFNCLDSIKMSKVKFNSDYFFYLFNNINLINLTINKINIISYYPLCVCIYTNKKILYNQKKYVGIFLLKNVFLKNIPMRLIFK